MHRLKFLTIILTTIDAGVMLCGFSEARAALPSSEREALIAIYLATNGNGWVDNTNWCVDACPASGTPVFNVPGTECTWKDVACDDENTYVVALTFLSNRLTGQMPSVSAFTQINYIYLQGNALTGTVPNLAMLPQLYEIDMSDNQLSGALPDFSGLNLIDVSLANNRFSGPLIAPVAMGNLEDFDVSGNQLSGTIPDFPGNASLGFVNVANNQFTGPFPDLSRTNISWIYVDHNHLSGPLPPVPESIGARFAVRLCPNDFSLAPGPSDEDWDFVTATTPWWGPAGAGCDLLFAGSFDG